jgi:hypothetical protein
MSVISVMKITTMLIIKILIIQTDRTIPNNIPDIIIRDNEK